MSALHDDVIFAFCHSFFYWQLPSFTGMGLWHLKSRLLCGRCVPTTNQDITDRVHLPGLTFPLDSVPFNYGKGIYWKEVKYARIVWMYEREHFKIRLWQRPSHIVIPPWKNGRANFIITLFQLIKCMIIPWREIRGYENNWLTKLFGSHWATKHVALLCPLKDIFSVAYPQIALKGFICNALLTLSHSLGAWVVHWYSQISVCV